MLDCQNGHWRAWTDDVSGSGAESPGHALVKLRVYAELAGLPDVAAAVRAVTP
jgi:hypothetical protein